MNVKTKNVLAAVAKQNGVSVSEVEMEINKALEAAKINPDPAVQTAWAKIPHKGKTPTAEEVIAYIALQVTMTEQGGHKFVC